MGPSTILDDLVDTIEPCNGQEITRLDLSVIEVSDDILAVAPFVASPSLNEFHVELLHVTGWSRTEERNFRVGAQTAEEYLHGFNQVGEPVPNLIAQPEEMDAPCEYIPNFDLI